MNIWESLTKPFLALAPMAGITDMPFRVICSEFGADLVYSEMASVAALQFHPNKTLQMLRSSSQESPLIIQVFGSNPAQFANAARLLSDESRALSLGVLGYRKPAGIDINFGCPVSKVVKTGSGAMLFEDLDRSRDVIRAMMDNTDLPISVKIRMQAGQVTARQFLEHMADLPIAAVMIHGRTLNQGFVGSADFAGISHLRSYTQAKVIANGGINTVDIAQEALQVSGAEGIGLARGILGKPWLFKTIKDNNIEVDRNLVFNTIVRHADLVKADNNAFVEFRKHLCWYVTGLEGAREMRQAAVKINSYDEILNFVANFRQ